MVLHRQVRYQQLVNPTKVTKTRRDSCDEGKIVTTTFLRIYTSTLPVRKEIPHMNSRLNDSVSHTYITVRGRFHLCRYPLSRMSDRRRGGES